MRTLHILNVTIQALILHILCTVWPVKIGIVICLILHLQMKILGVVQVLYNIFESALRLEFNFRVILILIILSCIRRGFLHSHLAEKVIDSGFVHIL